MCTFLNTPVRAFTLFHRPLPLLNHLNSLGLLHTFRLKGDSELCIVMEYCGCGDLAQKVDRYKKRKQNVDERVIWAYLIQVNTFNTFTKK